MSRSLDSNTDVKSGVLMKKGGIFSPWKTRYVVLEDSNLRVYKDSKLKKQENEIAITKKVEIIENPRKQLFIQLSKDDEKKGKRKSYVFKAQNEDVKKDWVTCLKSVIEESGEDFRLFGRPLSEISKNPKIYDQKLNIPIVVVKMVNFIREGNRMKEEGIFRLAGNKDRMDEVRMKINKGKYDFDPKEDVNVVAGILKQFIGGIPEPLFLFKNYDSLVNSARENDQATFAKLKEIIPTLPSENSSLLAYLSEFLLQVSQFSNENKMTIRNLATVFGPNVLKGKSDDPLKLMAESDLITRSMESCILQHKALFSSGKEEEEEKEDININENQEVTNEDT